VIEEIDANVRITNLKYNDEEFASLTTRARNKIQEKRLLRFFYQRGEKT